VLLSGRRHSRLLLRLGERAAQRLSAASNSAGRRPASRTRARLSPRLAGDDVLAQGERRLPSAPSPILVTTSRRVGAVMLDQPRREELLSSRAIRPAPVAPTPKS